MSRTRLTVSTKSRLLALAVEHNGDDKISSQAIDIIKRFHPASDQHPNGVFANLCDSEVDTIVEFLGDLLVKKGIDADDELNGLGYEIERYIDIFSL